MYVADAQSNDISIFHRNTTSGVLTYKGATPNPYNGTCVPYIVRSDPSGNFVYTEELTSGGCTGTRALIGTTVSQTSGALIAVPGSPFANNDVHTGLTSQEGLAITP